MSSQPSPGGSISRGLYHDSDSPLCCDDPASRADLQHPSARSSDIALAFHARAEDWVGISR